MPLHRSLISAGPGSSIPITGGAATSGPIRTNINLAPVRIGGIFDRSVGDSPAVLPVIALAGVAILAFIVFRRRR